MAQLLQLDGLTADVRWFGAGEGPYTVLAKIAIANAMSGRHLIGALGSHLLQSETRNFHGRTLLDVRWAKGGNAGEGRLVAAIQGRDLAAVTDQWWRSIASDERLRFCPTCIATGFQSTLCQIDALTHCPIHGDPIADACPACGGATPRYALTRQSFDRPMVCPRCEAPYAPCWAPGHSISRWSEPPGTNAYGALAHWLGRADALSCTWPDQAAWMTETRDEHAPARKRLRVFELLEELCVGSMVERHQAVEVRYFDLPPSRANDPFRHGQASTAARTKIYKSIRRHYRYVLRARPRDLKRVRADFMWTYPIDIVMPKNTRVPAKLHAFLSWRGRFEEAPLHGEITTGRSSPLFLRPPMARWPLNWETCDRAWGHFAQSCLMQEINSAGALHQILGCLSASQSDDATAWMRLANRMIPRFNPQVQMWPLGLSCLVLEPPASGLPRQFVLVAGVLQAPKMGAHEDGVA